MLMTDLENRYHQVPFEDVDRPLVNSSWRKIGLVVLGGSCSVLLPMAALMCMPKLNELGESTSLFGRPASLGRLAPAQHPWWVHATSKESSLDQEGKQRFIQPRLLVQARAEQEAPKAASTVAADEKKWDFGRFAKQAGFFGAFQPPSPVKVIGRFLGNDKAQNVGPKTVLWSPTLNPFRMVWGSLDDVIMGGSSTSSIDASSGVWSGNIIVANGGFAGIRTKYVEPALDLTSCTGLKIKMKGQGQRIKFIIRDDEEFNGIAWSYSFDTNPVFDTTVKIKFSDFVPTKFAKVVDGEALNVASITTFQLTYSKFEYQGDLNSKFKAGDFQVVLKEIETY
eukprot:gnl/MRDRNA2_/MRDRNA2_99066_c0_seq1.p1 gnl/MRDRNA2_/MRDRNA2_99066_c0~~gnl/MRDRNA2_/MRDRNA2_99066_c0_seq1.p1  ORF type:complete len:338 (+),score=64.88 gnl/MRDRNA2_/MRDRNA2_99066_c0_seq1:103-1116(+)